MLLLFLSFALARMASRKRQGAVGNLDAAGSRGPEPSHDREAIARLAIEIADREGIDAVSMRRIASAIGSGTSSLYRYFARKDDLLNLMVDGALGTETFIPSGDWRADFSAIGLATRQTFLAHRWMVTALAGRPTLGPNRLKRLEATLGLLEQHGLSARERLVLIDTLISYVRGFVASEIADDIAIDASGLGAERWRTDQAAYVASIIGSGSYPRTTALFKESRAFEASAIQDQSFVAGLDLILDGIAAKLVRLGAGSVS